ncbi:hypothetical protein [Pseudonocardia cypriaca]|uniref:hypothetical protein n=1 Tax=Pseudonocardia cypriaca TaxID=882449 RepID=UPI0011507B73|nr:hypothetical protein [Pseudonocardia cypriaca]
MTARAPTLPAVLATRVVGAALHTASATSAAAALAGPARRGRAIVLVMVPSTRDEVIPAAASPCSAVVFDRGALPRGLHVGAVGPLAAVFVLAADSSRVGAGRAS